MANDPVSTPDAAEAPAAPTLDELRALALKLCPALKVESTDEYVAASFGKKRVSHAAGAGGVSSADAEAIVLRSVIAHHTAGK